MAAVVLLLGGLAGWWFGLRTPTHEVPRFVGDTAEAATAAAEALRWTVDDDTLVREDGTEAGEVVAQSPRPGTQLAEGRTVRLTVSLGPTLVAYPSGLVGRPVAESEAAVAAADLRVGEVTTAFDEEVSKGLVVTATPSVDPDRSGEVPRGTPVDLVVSDGPAPRTVPDGLVGLPRAVAGARLNAEGLRAAVEEVFDESAPRGAVLRLGTPSGTEVPRGTTVTLVVSKGRAPVPVPDVTGRTGTEAVAVLEGAGFPVAGIEGPPGGAVLATDPPAGEARPPGTPVRVFTRQ